MRLVILALAFIFAACEWSSIPASGQTPAAAALSAPGETFKVGSQTCWYAKVHGMPCLYCEFHGGWGNSATANGGHSCDWSKWEPPAGMR